ncbi:Putative membrane protein YeiH [Salmonella enterica subsp. enterica]|nr:Putative membrane protein YeiH [Salmonella enterica subsp. enterica]
MGGAIPAVAGAGFSALTLAILLGMVIGNTVYPQYGNNATAACCLQNNIYCV